MSQNKEHSDFGSPSGEDLRLIKETLGEFLTELQKEFEDYFKESIEKIPSEYREQAKDIKNKTATYVKENPLKSVAFAFAAGYIISRLFRRKDS